MHCGLVLVVAFVASGALTAPTAAAQSTEAHKRIVQRVFMDILNRGQFELFDSLYDPAFVKHVDGGTVSLAQEKVEASAMRSGASDLVVTIEGLVAEDDRVAVQYVGRGTHDGVLAGLPASGRAFVIHGATVYRFRDGKIAEEWTYYNGLEIVRQLGRTDPRGHAGRPPGADVAQGLGRARQPD